MNDDDIRKIWRSKGGNFYGPITETGSMPESKLLPFLRELLTKECPSCEGLGAHPIGPPVKCGKCDGTGRVPNVELTSLPLTESENSNEP